MSNSISSEGVVNRLASQAAAVGRLAQDSGAFAATVAAFESQDPDAFRWVLNRSEMLPYCELLCEWIRVKICVLRCIRVCGPPVADEAAPDLRQFAEAVVRLASNQKLLRRAVDAVSCGDGDDFKAVLNELKITNYCHVLCHWICSILYRSVCQLVCEPVPVTIADPASEIEATAKVLSSALANQKGFNAIAEAAVALNCITLQSAIDQAGLLEQCELLCFFICVWRCSWVCREFCPVVEDQPIAGVYDIEEARAFALATRQLASQPRALGDLVAAVVSRDAKAFGGIIANYNLRPYCIQVCAWVCSQICHEFCICVCPPAVNPPLFYQVGNFNIYSEINPATGLTNTNLPSVTPFGGGPNFAFFEQLQLGGWCPATSPTSPGTPMMFRFLCAKNQTTLASPITSSLQTSITVTSNAGIPPTPFNISVCYSDAPYETAEVMTVNSALTTTWTVVRGVDGTTPAASVPVGATVAINPQPITGALVDKAVPVGAHTIPWPQPLGSGTGFSNIPTSETVFVGPGTDPLPPPFGSPTWYPPAHYIQPDPTTGWVDVDQTLAAGGVSIFLWFDSAQVVPAVCEITPPCFGTPGGAPAGTAVPVANLGVGTDLTIIFQATRVGVPSIDYSNSLCKIHVNNFPEVNNLWFVEFDTPGTTCCTPVDSFLSPQFTVDHEMIYAGGWSLEITSCAISPLNITPSVSIPAQSTTLASAINSTVSPIPVASVAGFPSTPFALDVGTETMIVKGVSPGAFAVVRGENGTAAPALLGATATSPGVTLSARGGAGTLVEDTSTWTNCSYQVWLSARAGLTTGLIDNDPGPNLLTFCICGHESLPAPAAASQAKTEAPRAKKR